MAWADGEVGVGIWIGTFMFLLREHENRKHQFRRKHRFNKHALSQTRSLTKRRPDIEIRRKQHANEEAREDTPSNLRGEK